MRHSLGELLAACTLFGAAGVVTAATIGAPAKDASVAIDRHGMARMVSAQHDLACLLGR